MKSVTRTLILALLVASGPTSARSVIECEDAYREMAIWQLDDIIEHHGYYRSTNETDNARFENALNHPDNFVWGVIHFDISNLKWQNDKGIKNKKVVNAMENLYRKGLFQRMKKDPLISRYLIEEASNFKTSRFAFSEVPATQREQFEQALSRAAEEAALAQDKFGKSYLAFEPATVRRIKKGGDLNSEIGRWHSGGFAHREGDMTGQELADVSALRSRLAREDIDTNAKTLPLKINSDGAVDRLKKFQLSYRSAMERLEAGFGDNSKIFETIDGEKMISMRLTDLIRKNPRPDDLAKAIKNILELEISDRKLLQTLIDSEKLANVFSPAINNVKRVIPIPQGYTVSIDIKGVGAKNSQMLMHELAKVPTGDSTNSTTVLNAVRAARKSEKRATAWVEMIKKHVVDSAAYGALTKTDDQVAFTGDDGLVNRDKPFQHKSVDIRRFFLQMLISTSPVPANQYRVVMVAPNFEGTDTKIPESDQFGVINSSEHALKSVADSFDPQGLGVSVSVDTDEKGGGKFRVYVTGEKVSPKDVKRVERLMIRAAPAGYVMSGHPEVIQYGIRP